MKRRLIVLGVLMLSLVALGFAGNYGARLYYAAGHGDHCADCHEMTANVDGIHASPHHNAGCTDCHEAGTAAKLRHIRSHMTGRVPEQLHLREVDVRAMMVRCRSCHQHEYANWHAGPHAATYSEIFTSPKHNAKRRLMDDCFRCHGMYFEGGVRDIVQPLDTKGPWHLTLPELANEPTIPCQTCHWIHRQGPDQTRPATRASVAGTAVRNSLAFYDRREEVHFRTTQLAIPQLFDGSRALKISADPRQGLCYQCHAPRQPESLSAVAQNHWGPQAGSGDDRTPKGVHEGLSCFSCHAGHNENARASCATCHPAMSNCGLDVEKMDTTYANASSKHNIHWVKCADCHQNGIPKVKRKMDSSNGE